MRRLTVLGAIAVAGFVLAAPGAKDALKKDSSIVGNWLVLSIDGQKANPTVYEFQADGSLIISTLFGTTESNFRWKYEVAEKAAPTRIDMTAGDTVQEGIFKIEGERLTICWHEGGGKRPKEFGEKGATLEVFERLREKY